MAKAFICMKCGSGMEYDEERKITFCPKCEEVNFSDSDKPEQNICVHCSSPLAYGKAGDILNFFCTNPACRSYNVREGITTAHGDGESIELYSLKLDNNGLYRLIYLTEIDKLFWITSLYDLKEERRVNAFISDDYELSKDYYITDIIKEIFRLHANKEDDIDHSDIYNVFYYIHPHKYIQNGLYFDSHTKFVLNELMFAIAIKDYSLLKRLLEEGFDTEKHSSLLDMLNDEGYEIPVITPMEYAAYINDLKAMEILLKHGADINSAITEYNSPLLTALNNKDPQTNTVEFLLENGADINKSSDIGENALMRAAAKNAVESLKLLIKYGAKVNEMGDTGKSPLMYAASYNSVDCVKTLLENGADINAKDDSGGTPLMYAAAYNGVESVKILIEHGADLNARDDDGITALTNAAAYNAPEAVKTLLELGANVNDANNNGKTSLMFAAMRDNTDIIKILLEHGADINVKDSSGKTALQYARKYESEGAEEMIEKYMQKS